MELSRFVEAYLCGGLIDVEIKFSHHKEVV